MITSRVNHVKRETRELLANGLAVEILTIRPANGSRWIENVDASFLMEPPFSQRQPSPTAFGVFDTDGNIDVVQAFTIFHDDWPQLFELQQFTNSGAGSFFAEENRRAAPDLPEPRGWANASLTSMQLANIDDSELLDVSFDLENFDSFDTYRRGRVAWYANDRKLGLQSEQLLLESQAEGISMITGDLDHDSNAENVTSRDIIDGMFVIDMSKHGDLAKDALDINRRRDHNLSHDVAVEVNHARKTNVLHC